MPWRQSRALRTAGPADTPATRSASSSGRRRTGRTRLTLARLSSFSRSKPRASEESNGETNSSSGGEEQPIDADADLRILLEEEEEGEGLQDTNPDPTQKRPLRRMSASLLNGVKKMGAVLLGGRDTDDSSSSHGTRTPRNSGISHASSQPDAEQTTQTQATTPTNAHALPDDAETTSYVVRDGDTLNVIALKHHMTLGQLRHLNRVFGSSQLFAGQTLQVLAVHSDAERVPSPAASPAAADQETSSSLWHKQRRQSTLGGRVFDGVTLLDRKIRVSGVLEVNGYFVGFTPLRFAQAPGATAAAELTTDEAIRLLRAYQLKLDVRDVQGVSAARARSDSRAERDATVGAIDAVSEHDDAEGATDKSGAFQVHIFWACAAAGFENPGPVLLQLQSEEACADVTGAVQAHADAAQRRAERHRKLGVPEADSVTSGAVLSGLLFTPCVVDKEEGGQVGKEKEKPVPAMTAFRRSRSSSFSAADAMHQRVLNGEISRDEAQTLLLQEQEAQAATQAAAAAAFEAMATPTKKKNGQHKRSKSASSAPSPPMLTPPTLAHVELRLAPRWAGPRSQILEPFASATAALNGALPLRVHSKAWSRVYDFDSCGVSLDLFFKQAKGRGDALLLIRTTSNAIVGAFTTEEWSHASEDAFYGTGESFVFRLEQGKALRVFKWTGANDYIMSSGATHIGLGAGGGFALCIGEDLDKGTCAARCETFGLEEPLCGEQAFRVAEMELIAFEAPAALRRPSMMSESSEPKSLFEE